MVERERESESLKLFEDTTAEERYYARSVKIRMACMEFMQKASNSNELAQEEGKLILFESIDDLAGICGNYVKKSGWDRKPASEVACRRWVRQYANALGFFKLQPYNPSQFMIVWRSGEAKKEVDEILAPFKRRTGLGRGV